jgi:hypothetical protein
MHILLAICVFVLSLTRGDLKNIEKYSLTIYYVIICNLLYNVICYDYLLWKYKSDIFKASHLTVDLLYTFIGLPGITFLFLSHFPSLQQRVKPFIYILKWVGFALLLELLYIKTGRLVLQNGYEYWMEFFFYPVMFGMVYLHQKKPLISYIFSVIIICFMVWYFDVPLI